MTKNTLRNAIALSAAVLALSACQKQGEKAAALNPKFEKLGTGKVVGVGKENLILDSDKDILFVSITPADRKLLGNLKKNDTVVLYGHKSKDNTKIDMEIDDVELPGGQHVTLGNK